MVMVMVMVVLVVVLVLLLAVLPVLLGRADGALQRLNGQGRVDARAHEAAAKGVGAKVGLEDLHDVVLRAPKAAAGGLEGEHLVVRHAGVRLLAGARPAAGGGVAGAAGNGHAEVGRHAAAGQAMRQQRRRLRA